MGDDRTLQVQTLSEVIARTWPLWSRTVTILFMQMIAKLFVMFNEQCKHQIPDMVINAISILNRREISSRPLLIVFSCLFDQKAASPICDINIQRPTKGAYQPW